MSYQPIIIKFTKLHFSTNTVARDVQDQLTRHDTAIKELQASNQEIKESLKTSNQELAEFKAATLRLTKLSENVLKRFDAMISGKTALPSSSSSEVEQLTCSTSTTTSTTTTTTSTTSNKMDTETVSVSTVHVYTFGKPPVPKHQAAVKKSALRITKALHQPASSPRPLSLRRKVIKPTDEQEEKPLVGKSKSPIRRKKVVEEAIVIKDSDDENDNSMPQLTEISQASPSITKKRKRIFVKEQESEPKRPKIVPRNVTKNQQARDNFTSAVLLIPDWLPQSFCALTYLVVKFFWVHEECVYQLKTIHQNERGQQNSSYRNKFHEIGRKAAQFFDNEAKIKLESDKLATIVSILPWYKKHQPQWSRPNIHQNTSHNSIRKFKFKTRTDFIENFLAQIGGECLICNSTQ